MVQNNVEIDRESIIKLKSDLRNSSDNSQNTISMLTQRLQELELQQKREE